MATPSEMLSDEAEVLPGATTLTIDGPQHDHQAMNAFFAEHGYLVLRGTLGSAELRELDAELERVVAEHERLPAIREGFNIERRDRWPDPDTPVFRKIGGMVDHSPAYRGLCFHPRILDALVAVLGPDIDLWRDVVMMKQARIGREKPWHQDGVYWPYRPCRQVSALTALDRMHAGNGGLQVIDGSHRRGALEHHGREMQVTLSPDDQARTAYVELEPGDTLLFHSLLLHGSEPNRSDQPRRVMINSYIDHHLEFIGANKQADRAQAVTRDGTPVD